MAEMKTKPTDASVDDFLDSIPDETVREDCRTIVELMRKATKAPPVMWGTSIIGFGSHRLKYSSGRELDWMLIGFSPRKANLALYISGGFDGHDELLGALGKHSGGKSCLYIKRLSDVHLPTLKKLIQASVAHVRKAR